MTHSHSHGHGHGAARAGARHRGSLGIAFALVGVFFLVELGAGLWTGSLALLSDAGHMFTDLLGLGMALAAIHLASAGSRTTHRTFGLYRVEILAALANGVLLLGVAVYVLVEAFHRFQDPPDVPAVPVLVVAGAGLLVNLFSCLILRAGAKESLNLKAAYLEVVSDAVGSVGVIVAAVIMLITGWHYADPIIGAAIGIWILPRTYRIVSEAFRILVQAAPAELDVKEVANDLSELGGVVDIHDFHLWTLTSGMEVCSAHIRVSGDTDPRDVLVGARQLLRDRYHVTHATLQVESEDDHCEGCAW